MSRSLRFLVLPIVVGLALPAAATAQVLQRPRRPFTGLFGGGPPPDPNRGRQELTLTVNVLGGYDDNLSISDVGSGRPPDPGQDKAGYLGSGDLHLRFWRGTAQKSLEIDGRGYVTSYSNTDAGAIQGGSFRLGATTAWGRRGTIRVDQRNSFDPLYTLGGGFAPLRDAVGGDGLPGANSSTAGIFIRDSWTSDSVVGLDYRMGPSNQLSGTYSFDLRRYTDEQSGDSWAHHASLAFMKNLARSASLRATYGYGHTTLEEVVGAVRTRPIEEHSFDVGPSYIKRISRTRQMLVSASAGAIHVESISNTTNLPFSYWAPYGAGQARLDLGRSWALWGDYRRAMTVLDGLTSQTYMTDTAQVSVGGLASRLVELVINGGFANGRAPNGSGSDSHFDTYIIGFQGQVAITRNLAAFVNYSHFDYTFTATSDLPIGFQPSFSRNSARFGIRLWVPLLGRYVDRGGNPGGATAPPSRP